MPSRNSLKTYIKNGFYHVYNRGVEKRVIFQDEQDYGVFQRYLGEILTPPEALPDSFEIPQGQSFLKNYADEINLLAYCLMPNHFHFEVQQLSNDSLIGFMRALMTRYSMYFNKKYDRVGSLFQGRYKAVLVETENYLAHLSRYIHTNPSEIKLDLTSAHSSYKSYLGMANDCWVKPDLILSYFNNKIEPDFKKVLSYKMFVENPDYDSNEILGSITLE